MRAKSCERKKGKNLSSFFFHEYKFETREEGAKIIRDIRAYTQYYTH